MPPAPAGPPNQSQSTGVAPASAGRLAARASAVLKVPVGKQNRLIGREQHLTHRLPDRQAWPAAAVRGVSSELPSADCEVGRILASRVAVAVRVAAVAARIVLDALQGDCTECRTLDIWVLYDESGRVTGLSKTVDRFSSDYGSLENMGLSGVIPPEIGDLTALTDLELSSSSLSDGPLNELTGSIPQELGNLSSLEWLSLAGNGLSGTIPSEIGNLTSLTSLWLYSNQLTGPIPPEIGNLSNLTHLALSSNQLTGPIPPEIGNLSNLTHLALSSNQLTGPIPPEIGNLSNLTHLALSSNQFDRANPAGDRQADQPHVLVVG